MIEKVRKLTPMTTMTACGMRVRTNLSIAGSPLAVPGGTGCGATTCRCLMRSRSFPGARADPARPPPLRPTCTGIGGFISLNSCLE